MEVGTSFGCRIPIRRYGSAGREVCWASAPRGKSRPWWDGETPEFDHHMSWWDISTPKDDYMLSHSSDDAPEPIGASAAGVAFWEGRLVTSRQIPSLIFLYHIARSCCGEARDFDLV